MHGTMAGRFRPATKQTGIALHCRDPPFFFFLLQEPEDDVKAPSIREGLVEKKGHSMAYFNWATRRLVVRQGRIPHVGSGVSMPARRC